MARSRIISFVMVLALLALPTACMQFTRITTEPDDANVTINGQYIGQSPVTFRYRSGSPKSYEIRVEKRGYKVIDSTIESVLKANVTLLLLLPGIIPYFFTATLEDSYNYKLLP